MELKLAILASHSIRTSGKPVLALILQGKASDKTVTKIPLVIQWYRVRRRQQRNETHRHLVPTTRAGSYLNLQFTPLTAAGWKM